MADGFRRPLTAVLLVLATAMPAHAGVRISRVLVDGRDIALPVPPRPRDDGGSADRAALRIPSGTRHLELHVTGGRSDAPPDAGDGDGDGDVPAMNRGMRLRHQLDGVDGAWRDAAAKVRVFLQFHDAEGDVLDTSETLMEGESPGWTGLPQTSAFKAYELAATAPPGAARVTAHFLSHGGANVVGWIGVDDVAIEVLPPGGGQGRRNPWPLALADAPPKPLDTPPGWTRRGGRSAMAQLRMRRAPTPHPILVILDDDPTQYGNWSMLQGEAVEPGDRVRLSWTAAHSLGIGGSTVAAYGGLEPGNYTFRVGAFRPGGESTGQEASLSIDVAAAWHRRPETWLAAAVLFLGAAAALGRTIALRRVKRRLEALERAHALERERTRIARDLHDEVGAALTEIAMQQYWVQQEIAGCASPATRDRLEKARQSAVDLVRSVDAIVWAVNPANDTLDRFVPYLTHSIEQFAEAAAVRLELDVPDLLPAEMIDGGTRHALFLVVREAVNNAVKHGRPAAVRLLVRFRESSGTATRMQITIVDDGRGIDAADAASGDRSGIANMRRRIEDLGGAFSIESAPGRGTRIEIDLPLPTPAALS